LENSYVKELLGLIIMSKIIKDLEHDIYSIMAWFGIEDYSNVEIQEWIKQSHMRTEDLAYVLCKSPERIKDYKAGRVKKKTRIFIGRELRKIIGV